MSDLITRLNVHATSWRRHDAFEVRGSGAEAAIAEEAATALSERDKQIAALELRAELAASSQKKAGDADR